MSLASICTRMAALVGVAPAQTWAGNPDLTASEIVAWVQEAQQQLAASHDWATLTASAELTITAPDSGPLAVPLPSNVARLIPDSVYVGALPAQGPLTQAQWQELLRWPGSGGAPSYTLAQGAIQLACAGLTGPLAYRYVLAVPDYVSDPEVTVLGGGAAELIRLMERCILYTAIALYRDAKGLPVGGSAAQAVAALAEAKNRDQPVGALTLSRQPRRHGFAMGRNPQFVLDSSQSYMS